MINFKKLLTHQPQIPGYEDFGPEPCIAELVHRYYRMHFDDERALELSTAYTEALSKITDILH